MTAVSQQTLDSISTCPRPRMLIYGEQNNTHSYLPNLDAAASVELSAIPQRPPM
jgi:hypothetical protein